MAKREKTRSSLGSLNEEEEHGKVGQMDDSFMNVTNTSTNLDDSKSQQNEQHKLRLTIGKLKLNTNT